MILQVRRTPAGFYPVLCKLHFRQLEYQGIISSATAKLTTGCPQLQLSFTLCILCSPTKQWHTAVCFLALTWLFSLAIFAKFPLVMTQQLCHTHCDGKKEQVGNSWSSSATALPFHKLVHSHDGLHPLIKTCDLHLYRNETRATVCKKTTMFEPRFNMWCTCTGWQKIKVCETSPCYSPHELQQPQLVKLKH